MAVPIVRTRAPRSVFPGLLSVVLGTWLFISAFVWPHTHTQETNTWVCGLVVVIFALIGTVIPWVLYLNLVVSMWLFLSAWALITVHPAAIWSNSLVAIALLLVSLAPAMPAAPPQGYHDRPAPPRPV